MEQETIWSKQQRGIIPISKPKGETETVVLRTQKNWSSIAVGEGLQEEVCLQEMSRAPANL